MKTSTVNSHIRLTIALLCYRYVSHILIGLFLSIAVVLNSQGQNRQIELAQNGNFDNCTEYTGYNSDVSTNWSFGIHQLVNNPNNFQGWAPSFTDHTGNGGCMMFVDGPGSANHRLWYNTYNVTAGTTITMSVWVRDFWGGSTSGELFWGVNGVQVGSIVSAVAGVWTQVTTTYTATTSGPITIAVYNQQDANPNGNDFAIDDVSVLADIPATCSGTFQDTGGSGDYSNNEDYTVTYCSNYGENVRMVFTQWNTQQNQDVLRVYDGTSTSSNLVGSYSGNGLGNSPGTVTSTEGCLTFRFTTNGGGTRSGWQANISCINDPNCSDIDQVLINDLSGGSDIDITGGATVFIGQLPSNWNIEGTGTVGSQRFEVTGNANQSNTESASPYRMPNDTSPLNWPVGTYNMTVTQFSQSGGNGNICDIEEFELVIDDCAINNLNASANSPICTGQTLDLTVSGGGAGATYSWTGPNGFSSTTQNPSVPSVTTSSGGNYQVTAINGGCSATANVNVSVRTSPITTVTSDNATCGNNDGSITFTFVDDPGRTGIEFSINGGSSYGYNIGDNQGSQTVNNLGPATYDTWVRWGNDECPVDLTDITIIRETGSLTTSSNDDLCAGSSTTISASLNNAVGSSTYAWSNGLPNGPSHSVSPIATTTYQVTGTDSEGCTATGNITISVNSLVNPNPTSNSPVCAGGDISLSSSNGTSYSWTGPNGFSSLLQNPTLTGVSNNASGAYTVSIVGGNSCTNSAVVNVSINSGLTVTASTPNAEICAGTNLSLSSSGADNYSWTGPNGFSSNSQNPTITNAATNRSGTYTVTGSLTSGCSASATVAISVIINNPIAINDGPKCMGSTINLSASGGDAYSWTGPNGFSSNSQNPIISNAGTTEEGVYTVTVTVAGACPETATTNLTLYSLPNVSVSNSGPICLGQNISLNASGGVSYAWTGPSSFSSSSQNPTVTNITNSKTGTYEVTVTNASGCSAIGTTEVSLSFPNLSVSSDTALCSSGTINLNATGGVSYNWSGPNGFSSSSNSISIPNATSVHEGTYEITISNTLGCTATTGVDVTILETNSVISSNGPVCTGDSLKLKMSGWTNYSWTGPSSFTSSDSVASIASPTVANSGIYSVTASVNGCTATASVSAVVRPLPVPNASSNQPVCLGTTANLTSDAAASYSWSGPNGFSSSIRNPSFLLDDQAYQGSYTLVVSNSFGCLDSTTHFVNVSSVTPTVTNSGTACLGTNPTITATGGNSYVWLGPNSFSESGATRTISNATMADAGVYSVTITNIDGCSATTSTELIVSQPIPSATSNSPVCTGTTLNLQGSGGFVYDWSGPGGYTSSSQNANYTSIPLSGDGIYTLTVIDSVGCTATATTNVTVNPLPNANASDDGPTCEGDNLTLTSSGGTSYAWAGPDGFLSSSQNPTILGVSAAGNGIYTVQVTDANGCVNNATTDVTVNSIPNVTATAITADICVGQQIQLRSTGGDNGSWVGPNGFSRGNRNPNINNATVAMSGTYTFTARIVPEQCTATATVAVTVNTIPDPPLADSVSRCGPGSVTLVASGCAGVYNWYSTNTSGTSLGIGDTFVTPSLNSDRSYFVDCTEFTCPSSARTEVEVEILPLPTATANITGVHCIGTVFGLFGGGNNVASYTWNGPAGFTSNAQSPIVPLSSSSQAGTYTITTTRDNGCTATATTNLAIGNNCTTICTEYVQATPSNPSSCTASNGSIFVQSYAGFFYETSIDGINWFDASPNSHNFTGLGIGTHLIYLRDRNSNTICRTVYIDLVANLNNFYTGETVTAADGCFEPTGSIEIQGVLPSDEVTWISSLNQSFVPLGSLSPANTITNLSPGAYYVKVIRNSNPFCFTQRVVDVPNAGAPCITGVFCPDSSNVNLFPNGDFGSGSSVVGPPLDPSVSEYGFVWMNCNSPNDGFYTIVNNTDCDGTSGNNRIFGTWDVLTEDHTEGDTDGYMMMVNASFNPDIVVEQNINDLCPNAQYNFTAYIRDLLLTSLATQNPILPNLSFLIDGVVQYTTGPITSVGDWEQVGFSFKTGNNTSAVFSIRNNAPGGYGNDWLIDDVVVSKCPLEINLEGTTVACLGGLNEEIEATVADPLGEYSWYKWQESLDNGVTWTDIVSPVEGVYNSGVMEVSMSLPTPIPSAISGIDYRIVLATASDGFQYEQCTVTSALTKILVPPLNLDLTDDIEKCIGSGSVDLTALASGGTAPYSYTWANAAGNTPTITVNPNSTTTYIVDARDVDSCGVQDTVTVTILDQPTLTVTIEQDSVCLNGNTDITARVVGGSGDFQFTWYESNDATNWTVIPGVTDSVLSPNTNVAGLVYYQVFVEDLTFDCNDATSNPVPFTVVPLPVLDIGVVSSPVCLNGVVTLSAQVLNGAGDIGYQWYGSLDNVNFTALSTDTLDTYLPPTDTEGTVYYRVEANVTASGCGTVSSSSTTLEVLPVFDVAISVDNALVCEGAAVSLSSDTTTSTGTVSYQWSSSTDNVTFNTITGATNDTYIPNTSIAGTIYYELEATASGSGCGTATSESVSVEVLPTFDVSINPSDVVVCIGGNVTLDADTSNGTGSISYQWFESTDNVNFTSIPGAVLELYNAPSGVVGTRYYRVDATASGPGCGTVTSASVSVEVLPVFSVDVNLSSDTLCVGGNVTLTADTTNGTGTVTYQWQASTDNVNFTNLSGETGDSFTPSTSSEGTTYYRVLATASGSGCGTVSSSSASIVVLPVFDVTVSLDNAVLCLGGSAVLTVDTVSGTGIITYQWYDSNDNISFSPISGATNLSYTAPTGSVGITHYRVEATASGNGCGNATSSSASVEILPVFDVDVTLNNAVVCIGGAAVLIADTVNGTGTITYQWESSTDGISYSPISGATSATYNANTSSAGLTYYRVSATASGSGCGTVSSDAATVEVLPVFSVDINPSSALVCVGGAVTLTSDTTNGTGTVTYQWQASTDNVSFTNVTGATSDTYVPSTSSEGITYYRVIATASGSGCGAVTSASVPVVVLPVFDINISVDNALVCEGGAVLITSDTVSGAGTVSFQWYSSTDGMSYSAISGATGDSLIPNTGTVGTTYYRVEATSSGIGCGTATSAASTVEVQPQLSVSITPGSGEICLNETYTLTSSTSNGVGNITYQWQLSTDGINYTDISGATSENLSVNTSTAGYFYYRLNANADGIGCTVQTSAVSTLRIHDFPSVTRSFIRPLCEPDNGSITFTFSDAAGIDSIQFSLDNGVSFPYTINDDAGSFTINGLDENLYEIEAQYQGGLCPVSVTDVNMLGRPAPSVTASYTEPTCGVNNGTVTFTFPDESTRTGIKFSIDGGTNYTASIPDNSGSYTFSNLASGTYDLYTIWGNNQCPVDVLDVTLTDQLSPVVSVSLDTVMCEGDSYAIAVNSTGGTAPITYAWNNGLSNAMSHVVSPLVDTYYIVTVTDSNNCQVLDSIFVEVNPVPVVTATGGTYCEFDTIQLGATGVGQFTWTGPSSFTSYDQNPSIVSGALTNAGTYSVVLTNNFSCASSATAVVVVNETPPSPNVVAAERCGPGTLNLSASNCSGTISWYDAQFSNTPISTNANITTGNLDATQFYFVTCTTVNNCSSVERLPVEATIKELSVAEILPINTTCYGTIPLNNGQLIATRFEDGETFSFNEGSSYNSGTATSFATIPANGLLSQSINNPTTATQSYTIRINSVDSCPRDITVDFQESCIDCLPYCEPSSIERVK